MVLYARHTRCSPYSEFSLVTFRPRLHLALKRHGSVGDLHAYLAGIELSMTTKRRLDPILEIR